MLFKFLLITTSLFSLLYNKPVNTSNDNVYRYDLPYQFNENIDLSYSTLENNGYSINNTQLSNVYYTDNHYFNNTFSVSEFYHNMRTSSYDKIFNDDTLSQTYNRITSNIYNFESWIDYPNQKVYLYALIDGYIDSTGTYQKLDMVDYTINYGEYIGMGLPICVFNHTSEEYEWSINCSLAPTNLVDIWLMQYPASYNYLNARMENTHFNIDLNGLLDMNKIYIKGFITYTQTAINQQFRPANFILQYILYKLYGSDIIKAINYPSLKYWFTDGHYTNINKNFKFTSFNPYFYLGFNTNSKYVVFDSSIYTYTEFPNILCIYNGLFKIGDTYFDNIYITYEMEYSGFEYSINGVSYFLNENQRLLWFRDLVAYNSLNGSFEKLITHNTYLTSDNDVMIYSFNYYHYYDKDINFINCYYYGTEHYNNTSIQWTYPMFEQKGWKWVDGYDLFLNNANNFASLKTKIIDSAQYKNYYENIFNMPTPPTPPLPPTPPTPEVNILIQVFDLFSLAFGSISSFLNIQVFPNITIGLLLLVPLIITLIIIIVRLFKR